MCQLSLQTLINNFLLCIFLQRKKIAEIYVILDLVHWLSLSSHSPNSFNFLSFSLSAAIESICAA